MYRKYIINIASIFIILLLIQTSGISQNVIINSIPTDTTFTVYSAWQKIKKKFPNAKPVKPFHFSDIISNENLVYRKVGPRQLHIDIFHPETKRRKFPAILLIHGGGWRSGNKSHMAPLAQKLAKKGYVTAAVEYRLSAEALYPAGIYDLKEAVKFLKSLTNKLPIDSSRIIALGCSAGATLATFLGTTVDIKKFEPPQTQFPKYLLQSQQ